MGANVDPEMAAEAFAAGDSPLTPREADVLELAAEGAPSPEVLVVLARRGVRSSPEGVVHGLGGTEAAGRPPPA